jgi:hypothetical protein
VSIEDSRESRDENRKLFRRMALSHFDFEETRRFLDRLQPIKDDIEIVKDDALRTALMTALIVSYWRPFSTSKADGQTAKYLPSDELLQGLSPVQLQLHTKVGNLRNQEFAHTDPKPAELEVNWNLRDKGFGFPVGVSNATRIGLTPAELTEFRTLLFEVSLRMFKRYAALGEVLLEDSKSESS